MPNRSHVVFSTDRLVLVLLLNIAALLLLLVVVVLVLVLVLVLSKAHAIPMYLCASIQLTRG